MRFKLKELMQYSLQQNYVRVLLVAMITLLGVVATPTTKVAAAEPAASSLKINLLAQPFGIANSNPAFSWTMTDADSNSQQSAYRIVVSKTKAKAQAGNGDIVATNWVKSTAASGIHIDNLNKQLTANSLYYWSVQLKDTTGQSSAWATPQAFTTAAKWQSTKAVWTDTNTGGQASFWQNKGWGNYQIELELKTETALGIVFRNANAKENYMLQIRSDTNEVVPHYTADGNLSAYKDQVVKIKDLVLPKDKFFHVRLDINGDIAKTYVKLASGEETLVATTKLDKDYDYGSIGFRTGRSESAQVDNVQVTQLNQDKTTLYTNDFSNSQQANDFKGCTVKDGALTIPNGVLTPSVLSASTIDPDEGAIEPKGNFVFARKAIQIDQVDQIEKAIVSATAKSGDKSRQYVYTLSLNGAYVGVGPTRGSGAKAIYYNTYDVTDKLKDGENVLGAINYSENNQGFLYQMTLYYKDGTSRVVTNSGLENSGWQVKDGTNAFGDNGSSLGTGYYKAAAQNLNAAEYPTGWDEPGYQPTAKAGWQAPVDKGNFTKSEENLEPYTSDNIQQAVIKPTKVTAMGAGHYLIDLGKEIVGGFGVGQLQATQPGEMEIRYGEEMANGQVKWQMRTGNNYREYWTLKAGSQTLNSTDLMTYRYVEVLNSPVVLTVDNVYGLALHQDFNDDAAKFTSSNKLLNQIYDFTKYSIKATNQDLMVDSQSRERGAYEGDVLINALSSYSFSDNYSLSRFTNEWLTSGRTWPAEYVLFTVMTAWNDYQYTGNKDSLVQYYDAIKANGSNLYTKTIDSNGLVNNSKHNNGWDSVLVDWPTTERDGYVFGKYNTVLNAVAYGAYQDMAQIAKTVGNTQDQQLYQGYADKVKAAMIRELYDADKGAFKDSEGATHYSQHATAFALAYGVYDSPEMAGKLANYIKAQGEIKGSVYGAYFLLDGLYNVDAGQTAMKLMTSTGTRSWDHVINELGATISTEAWDPKSKPNMTFSHPWGSAPASQIVRGMFGIRPTTPGFKTFQVKFQPEDVQTANISVPTVKGQIDAEYTQNADKTMTTAVTIPANTKATIYLPMLATNGPAALMVDGKQSAAEKVGQFLKVELGSGKHAITNKLSGNTDGGDTGGNDNTGNDNSGNDNTGGDTNTGDDMNAGNDSDENGNQDEDTNTDTGQGDQDLHIHTLPFGTIVYTDGTAKTIFADAKLTQDTNTKLVRGITAWAAFEVAKDANGQVKAYRLGKDQWVAVKDILPDLIVSPLPLGTVVFSDGTNKATFTSPKLANISGALALGTKEWAATYMAQTITGKTVAYCLGDNQWVTADNLQLQRDKSGLIVLDQGTPLFGISGQTIVSRIVAAGNYKVFAERYINGQQALKLGTDTQWVLANAGAYYP
ncbi:MAG: family 78 glycoside hydrolase catalytic domain [Lactobacillus sp.]|nr:family 78 glycoside hydrolase catalytic domain [Lactobacillus sp.]